MEDTPTSQRRKRDQHTASPMTLILVVFTLRFPRWQRNRRQPITQKLAWPFVTTHDWRPWSIWLRVTVQHIFQMPDRVARDVPSTPTLDQPRLTFVVFRAVLTVGRDLDATTAHATSFSASHGNVHRPDPSGGSAQASMVHVASTRPSICAGAPRRGVSSRALLRPARRDSWRTRSSVVLCTPNTFVMSSSVGCSSANHKIRARFMALADFFPCLTYCCHCWRSSSLNWMGDICSGIANAFLRLRLPYPIYVAKLF
jgi:hypothetical protein